MSQLPAPAALAEAKDLVARNRALNRQEVVEGRAKLASTPLQLNIELTGVCDIQPPCVFCTGKNVGYNYPPLDAAYLDDHEAFLDRCEKVNEDSFGEPLTHRALVPLAQKLTSRGQRFTFVSNGLKLRREIAEGLARCGPNLGLHISFNAATAETFFKLTGQQFDPLVDNVRSFVELYRQANDGAAPDLTLTFIVMKVNRHEVPDFVRLVADLGVHGLLAPLHERPSKPLGFFGYDFVYEEEMLPFADLAALGREAQQQAEEVGVQLFLQFEASRDSALQGFAEPGVEIPCLIPWRFLYVQEHSKNVYGCPYHKRPLGSLAEQSLDEVWNGEAAQGLRRELRAGKIPKFCWDNSASCPLVYSERQKNSEEPVGTDIVVGSNDRQHFLDGWHPLEQLEEATFRWSRRRASFRIAAGDRETLCIQVLSFRPGLEDDPVRGSLKLGETRFGAFRIERIGWQIHRARVPWRWRRRLRRTPGPVTVTLEIDNPWHPSEVLESSVMEAVINMPRQVEGSRDTRELGVAVGRIWME